MTENIRKETIDIREEIQSNWVKYRDDVEGKYAEMVNRLQTELADLDAARIDGSMPTPATTKRKSPFTKASTTFAMPMGTQRDTEETFFATGSVEGRSRSIACEVVQLRASPS